MLKLLPWRRSPHQTLTLLPNTSFPIIHPPFLYTSRFLTHFHSLSDDLHDPPFSPISKTLITPQTNSTNKNNKKKKITPNGSKKAQVFPLKSDLPFDFRYSYSEANPSVEPIAFREPPRFSPFGPGRLDRKWTGTCAPAEKGVDFAKVVEERNAVLGEPLAEEEADELVERYRHSDCSRQINLGNGGVTHNMIEDIHNHWKRAEAVRIKCLGVPTLDMDNVCFHLEDKSGGKVIYRHINILLLYRGRNYDPKKRPVIPLMLWKPYAPIYPKLVKNVADGLSFEETKEMRNRGLNAPPLMKLTRNGVYVNVVERMREAFETEEVVRLDCAYVFTSDCKKIGVKLRDLVPCVPILFKDDQIVLWRGKKDLEQHSSSSVEPTGKMSWLCFSLLSDLLPPVEKQSAADGSIRFMFDLVSCNILASSSSLNLLPLLIPSNLTSVCAGLLIFSQHPFATIPNKGSGFEVGFGFSSSGPMVVSCDLEVEVNGEEIFVLDKDFVHHLKLLSNEHLQKTICFYSGRLSKLIGKSRIETQGLKLIFHDFPGGPESFELMTRFCYNSGKLQINPLNLTPLHCVAQFMEMSKTASGALNLLERTEKCLEEIRHWTWSELLVALKQCQDLLPVANSCNILEIYLDSLVGRLSLASETSPCPSTSSPDSFDSQSYESLKSSSFRATWWFEDLVALNPYLIEMVTKSMVSWKFDHATLSRFLFYYQKSRFIRATSDEKRVIAETVVNMLSLLDWSAISCKSLFGILRVALSLNISKLFRDKLESMIGSQMDQATLDNLLVPPPAGVNYLYDVNLVLSFVKSFVGQGLCCVPLVRLKKVASLMDLYIAEVAPDPSLKPSKFLYLVTALPDHARDSYDAIYSAMDMYLEVHAALSEEEKVNVCYGLNYEKLSSEVYKHLTQNKKFPSKSVVQTLISPQCNLKTLRGGTDHPKPFIDSSCSFADIDIKGKKDEACEQILLYVRKLDLPAENEKLRANLQGMQWRVAELEKLRAKMQNQMTKMLKSRSSSQRNGRSLPRLCS
ncbi:hypothetical protein RHMOL_Rhmol04G0083100 [Rhododendron molle]|uniref:Uncharacterized protein n=1 Tax=Rhododendron molle TaxID=49168 RepID=A0ACC0NYM4_RHOML|nr:hypothetical protein RHMOL_Rhmol04G0083100 [Rhododendron molle]